MGGIQDFNPRSPHGERRTQSTQLFDFGDFNPRSPHGERRSGARAGRYRHRNFNPRSPHGERHQAVSYGLPASNFNPRSPHGERLRRWRGRQKRKIFQSTLPTRGATCLERVVVRSEDISIHAPHTGSDAQRLHGRVAGDISIHAPHTGSDRKPPAAAPAAGDFNPRSPHGERRRTATHKRRRERFQSTLPTRGATPAGDERGGGMAFQSTLPTRGATPKKVVS